MTALLRVPVRTVVRCIADAARRWADADFPRRVRVLDAVVARTGYSVPVVEYALDRIFESITERALLAVIADELGSVDALDAFVARPPRDAGAGARPRARALPIGRVCVISSRTTIGVAIVPAVLALCAKCDVIVKDREDSLVAAFFHTLAEEHDALSSAAIAQTWDGRADAHGIETFAGVVAFGRDETLTEIRARCSPEARFAGFGSKTSVGYVEREALAQESAVRELCSDVARDLALYETEGCLSLSALFVERGGAVTPERFCALLSAALERAAVEFPRGTLAPTAIAALGVTRASAQFRAASGSVRIFSDDPATHLVILDAPHDEQPAFLPRVLAARSVDAPQNAATYLRAHNLPLEAIAVAARRDDVVAMALQGGVARIARFGELQNPLLEGNHGGRARITDFVRWVTDEIGT